MSSQTNIPINSRSMNGIITISDGGGTTIEDGQVTTTNLFAPNVATLNENETISGIYTFTPNLPQSSVVPTLGAQLVNKTYVDGLDGNNVKISGSQTLTTGIKTFTNLPQCSAAPTLGVEFTNKTYVDGLDAQNVKISGTQSISGTKTFNSLPECSVVPTTANQLTNKTYVDGLDSNNVKKTGTQSVAGLKTFTEAVRINNSVNDGFLYLGTGTNEVILYETSGFGYLQSKNAMSFFTNSGGLGSASRVVINDTGLVINTGQALFLNTTGTAIIISASNLMSFYVPTSNQFNWLINNVQCGLLDAGGLTLTGGLSVGNGQNVTLNNAGSTISSTATDMTYTATGASANHYFNIGASTIAGVNANGLTIQDTKILQFGSTNTTNIQKVTASSRLDYNVPTGFNHSFRIAGAEVAAVGTLGINIGDRGYYMNNGSIFTLTNITYIRNDTATTGKIEMRAGGAGVGSPVTITANALEYSRAIVPTYTTPSNDANQLGNIRLGTNTPGTITSNVVKSLSNITLPAGVWLLVGQMNIQSNGAYSTGISNYCVSFATSATSIQTRNYVQDNYTSSIISTGFGNDFGFFAKNLTEVVSLSASTQIWFNCRFFCNNTMNTLGISLQATRIA